MRLLLISAFIAVVSSSPLTEPQPVHQQSPWQNGKQYLYEVNSHTLSHFYEGTSSGNAFKANFIIRVTAQGLLQAKLEEPRRAQFHQKLDNKMQIPADLKYTNVVNLDQPFEISFDGGRILSLRLPEVLSVANENLLKGLISTLQVDLTNYRLVNRSQDSYDKNSQQGLFSKFETDVTGDCETVYSVSPVNAEWRREVPHFASDSAPIQITKSKNYNRCHQCIIYNFGVPRGALWTGIAHGNTEKQFISHTTVSRILVGHQGIYNTETTSSVNVHPHIHGRQKAEVHSYIQMRLKSIEENPGTNWQKPEATRHVKSLLHSMLTKQVQNSYQASSESNEETEGSTYTAQQPYEAYDGCYYESSSYLDSSNFVNNEQLKYNVPDYAAILLHTQPHVDKKQNAMSAQKLLQDLAQQLQNPSTMPQNEFLTKFNILVRLISTMTTDQLAQFSRGIEVGKASNKIAKVDMWFIFRDAVIQAGTQPAFQLIETWIKTKKIQGFLAAEVISSLAKTLRHLTKDTMKQFFELALCPEVLEQKYLNSSALIAAAEFIRLGSIDYEHSYPYYPPYVHGRFPLKNDRFIIENILPRLSQLLKQAVEQEDYGKTLVIVKAIGTLGHREILKVFTPYLEGQIKVSTYLRVQMILALKPLAEQKDRYVRSALFSILMNTAEPYEVRVAAAMILFLNEPTTDMLRVMAQLTNDDPSIHVRAVLKSSIETAATLEGPKYWHLAKAAQSVKELVTSEDFGYAYSAAWFFAKNFDSEEVTRYRLANYIGSDGSLIPNLFSLTWNNRFYGRGAENTVGFTSSNVQDIFDYIKQLILQPRKSTTEHQFSADKIAKLLNIKQDPLQPIESSIYYKIFDKEFFWPLDQPNIKQLVNDVFGFVKELENGVQSHYTKVFYSKQVSVIFPIATGEPFVFEYKEPVVVHLQTKLSGKINYPPTSKDISSNIQTEIQFTFARNMEGSVGFIDTNTNQLANIGVVKKYQINLPVKINVIGQSGKFQVKLEPLHTDQDLILLHHSVWPYSAYQQTNTTTTPSHDLKTKLIKRLKKVAEMNKELGQQFNLLFKYHGFSSSNTYRNAGDFVQDALDFSDFMSLNDLAETHYEFTYSGKQSKTKAVTFTAAYDVSHNLNSTGKFGEAHRFSDVTPNSAPRREEIVKRVSSGIKTATARVIDFSASFEGLQKLEYAVTAAVAGSMVDLKTQFAVFMGSQSDNGQINAVFKLQKPQMAPLDFHKALNSAVKYLIEADVTYGENSNINFKGHTERSQEYAEQLKNSLWANQCAQENAQQNKFQLGCHNVLIESHAPDRFKASITYKHIPAAHTALLDSYIQGLWSKGFEYNPSKRLPVGQIELEANASYVDQTANVAWTWWNGQVRFNNLPNTYITPALTTAYQPIGIEDSWTHFANSYSYHQYEPFCTVDGTKVKTFSNRDYNVTLPEIWTVLMHAQTNWEELVVLAKRPNEAKAKREIGKIGKLDLYISHKTATGKHLEVNIPYSAANNKANVKVETNAQLVADGDLTTYWDDVAETPLLQYSNHPDRVLLLHLSDGLHLLFDGKRGIFTTSQYRNITRGICGQNSGDPLDDYKTPLGIVDHSQHFGAAFTLDLEKTNSQIQQWKKIAQETAYQPKLTHTVILRFDEEWKIAGEQKGLEWGSQKVYRSRSYQKQRGPCQVQNQVQYHENHGEICITTTPISACQSHCHSSNYQVQAVQAVCKGKKDPEFRMYKDQIHQGQNPQVTGVPKVEQYRVPTTCTE
uniref:Vitellogenin n=2 Tax=Lymantria dispar TaxID=13123 RepID=Q25269_LYMDI|nr:vitellogenin [Lymantria dispar]